MFDNVYWHHTNRSCMVMLLRAVQEALIAGVITADNLTGHDDASLLAFMQGEQMPGGTRRLASALAYRQIHKRAVEISARSHVLYERLGQLWYDAAARRDVEIRLAHALSAQIGEPVEDTAILIDIPKPEKWKTDVWVSFDQPPVGMQPLMHWQDVVGLGDTDFKRYEEHRRMIRIVTDEAYRHIIAEEWESLLYPALGGIATH
jgi:HD superfamily phosphohydrolase